jgi:hypothetical protein
MLGGMEVLRRVFVLRRIAASDVTAFKAHPQVHPAISGLDAVFADVLPGTRYFDLICVRTLD